MLDPLKDIVDAILARVGLKTPDGRALYAYRVTVVEAETLREALINALEPDQALRLSTRRAFCLWAADHYSRTYDGGPHQWVRLLDPLGFEENGIPNSELEELVLGGLAFWRRRIISSGGRELRLATLIREGGLPIALLRDEDSTVSTYFRALFELIEQNTVAGRLTRPGEELASELAERRFKIKRLSDPVIARLSSDLVEGVRRLARVIPKGAEPIAALDAAEPRWRDELPLRLDDDTAKTFLEGLLQEAVALRRRAPTALRWTRALRGNLLASGGWRWRLTGRLDVPVQAPLGVVRTVPTAAELGPEDPLFDRFVLETRYEDGSSDDWARGRRQHGDAEGDGSIYFDSIPQSRQALDGGQVIGRVELSLRAHGRQTKPTAEFPGGSALSDDPWIFVDEFADEVDLGSLDPGATVEATLVGQASCRIKHARAIVAITTSMRIRHEDGTPPIPLGTLDTGSPRQLYQVDRTAIVESVDTDDRYLVKPGVAISGTEHIDPEGNSFRLGPERVMAYVGIPKLRYTVAGQEEQIPSPELQWWRPGPGLPPQPLTRGSSPVGTGRVRWVRDGAVRYSLALTLLPERFKWKIDPKEGTLSFQGLNGAEIEVLTGPEIEFSIDRADFQSATIRARAVTRHSPAVLRVRFAWPTGSTRDLPFPFPAVVTCLAHRTEGPLKKNRKIAVHQLAQFIATSVRPDRILPKALVGHLLLRPGAHTNAAGMETSFEQPFPPLQEGATELPLNLLRERITDLFSRTLDRDAMVRLSLPDSDGPALLVKRYDLDTHSREGGFLLSIEDWKALTPREQSTLTMRAYDVLNPGADPLVLERRDETDTGGFRWMPPHDAPLHGMWIAALFDGDLVRSRPRLLPGIAATESEGYAAVTPLYQALGILGERSRNEAITQALQELALDPFAAGWELVMGILQRTTVLPPATFDVLNALILDDSAMATFLIRAAWDGDEPMKLAWDALHALPVGVHGISRATWITAFERAFTAFAALATQAEIRLEVLHPDIMSTRQRLMQHILWTEPLWDSVAEGHDIIPPADRGSAGLKNPKAKNLLLGNVTASMQVTWPTTPSERPYLGHLARSVSADPELKQLIDQFSLVKVPPEYQSVMRAPIQMAVLAASGTNSISTATRMEYRALIALYPELIPTIHRLAFWYACLEMPT